MAKKITSTSVSAEVGWFLDQIAGVPDSKVGDAAKKQMEALGVPPPGAHPLGIWWGGCYYTKVRTNTGDYEWKRRY
jgi:hypothetical protein